MAGEKNLKLKAAMAEREINIAQLAQMIGMGKGTLMRKINGQSVFKFDEAEAILDALGIPISEATALFFRRDT